MNVVERARAAADQAFAWIAASAVEVDGTHAWTENGVVDDSLYIGSAGVLLACADVVTTGVDGVGIDRCAQRARARLMHITAAPERGMLVDDGLFSGWTGVAVALRAWARAVGDDEADDAASAVLAAVASRAVRARSDRTTDIISGDAGVLVGLVTTGLTSVTRPVAETVAARLVAAAEETPAGLQWRMRPDTPRLMPNFSHGTAGVAYALGLAAHALDRPDLTAVAVRGAETLLAVGRTPAGWAVPLLIPTHAQLPPVFFGWCHGPSGTVRLFELLGRLQPGDPRWPETVAQCYDAVRTSGLPARHTPGFWDNVARCCGTAGVGTMVLDRFRATGDPAVLAWADLLAADVLDRATTTADGVCWSNTEHTATPPDLPPEPGFMVGAAGIATWLSRLVAEHDDPRARGVDPGVVPRCF